MKLRNARTATGGLAQFSGSIVALATPFIDGAVDLEEIGILSLRQVRRDTAAIVVCGSTGEASALTPEEHAAIVSAAVTVVAGRVPVIAGCGAPATAASVQLALAAAKHGAAGLLCAPPPYVKPTQDGIVAHIRAINQAAGLPIILYDIPGRVGVAIADDTIVQLVEGGFVAALKDATGDLARPARLRSRCGGALLQFTGDDATAAAYRAMGGHGCISVTANLVPSLCAQLHAAWDRGNLGEFARLRDLLAPLHDALFAESNPIPLKSALSALRLCSGELRLPLTRASVATRDRLATVLSTLLAAEDGLAVTPRLALVQ